MTSSQASDTREEMTREDVATVLDAVRLLCRWVEPDTMDRQSVTVAFDALAEMRRLVDGALTRLGPRYERCGTWRDRGARSAADDIAKATGASPADAKRRLDTGRKLRDRKRLDDALREGEVSTEQAGVIAGAGDDDASDDDLIDVARQGSHRQLREEAARRRAAADGDDAARRERQQRRRGVSRWTDEDGLYNLHLRTLPELGAEIDAALKPHVDRHFAQARKEGRHEPVQAYVADAVTEALTGRCERDGRAGRRSQAVRPERKVIALVDIEALRRGRVEGGETCEIAGVGPVSVAAVRAMFGDAAVAAVFRDAVDIRSVVHLGRQVTAHQRTALEARGPRCAIVGCGSTHQLEIDHCIGWTHTKTTHVDDLDWLCSTDHALKTRRDLLATGPPGQRVLVERDPDDPTRPRQPIRQVRPAPRAGAEPPAAPHPPADRSRPASRAEPDGAADPPPDRSRPAATLFDLAT